MSAVGNPGASTLSNFEDVSRMLPENDASSRSCDSKIYGDGWPGDRKLYWTGKVKGEGKVVVIGFSHEIHAGGTF